MWIFILKKKRARLWWDTQRAFPLIAHLQTRVSMHVCVISALPSCIPSTYFCVICSESHLVFPSKHVFCLVTSPHAARSFFSCKRGDVKAFSWLDRRPEVSLVSAPRLYCDSIKQGLVCVCACVCIYKGKGSLESYQTGDKVGGDGSVWVHS